MGWVFKSGKLILTDASRIAGRCMRILLLKYPTDKAICLVRFSLWVSKPGTRLKNASCKQSTLYVAACLVLESGIATP